MIKITRDGNRYVAKFAWSIETKDLVKAAGFRFDPARKYWWTTEPAIAARLQGDTSEIVGRLNRMTEERYQADRTAVAASRATDAAIAIPVPEGLDYLPYQKAGIAYALGRPAVLIADEMGLGKTIQAIGVINSDPATRRVFVICPASLKQNWANELTKWLVRPASIGIVNGKFPDTDIVIANYEQIAKNRHQIDAIAWDLLVVDECHMLKTPKAQRTIAVLGRWARDPAEKVTPITAKRRLFMSGTPMVNRPIELWSLLKSLDPQGLGRNFQAYTSRYCEAHNNGWGMDYSGAAHLDELQGKLRSTIMVRRLKKDVELPPKRRQIIALKPGTQAARAAVEAETTAFEHHRERLVSLRIAVELGKASDDPKVYETAVAELTQAAREAFSEISAARHDVALAKVDDIIEQISLALDGGEKLVVFAWHLDVIAALAEKFPGCAVITGETKIPDRQTAVDRFQTDPNCRLIIGSIRAMGVGFTLTAASHVLFGELDWVPGNLTQAEDRCILEGQRVMTPSGWELIEDLQIGDQVISHDGLPHRVTDKWNRRAAGSHNHNTKIIAEITVRGWPWPLAVTDDHQILTRHGWKPARAIRPSDDIAMAQPVLGSAIEYREFPDDCRVNDQFDGPFGVQRNGRLIKAPKQIALTSDALFVFGFYLGDGFSSIMEGKGRFISFSGHRNEKQTHLARCTAWAENLGINVSLRDNPDTLGTEIRAYSAEWARWFASEFGATLPQKKLPAWLFELGLEQRQAFLDGWLASDGYVRPSRSGALRYELVTASETLASQAMRLLTGLGEKPCLTFQSTGCAVVSFTKHVEQFLKVRSINFRLPQKIERVWDITVEDSETFILGSAVVHNCHRIGQRDNVLVQHIVLDGSLDARMAQVVTDKQAVLDQALDQNIKLDAPDLFELPEPAAVTQTSSREAVEAFAETLKPDQVAAIAEALQVLARVCDGAHDLDGLGFNKLDARIGSALACQPHLSRRQAALGYRIVTKYHRQLGPELVAKIKG